ncbi:flagellar export protein FliJ [Cellvibrio japonicus]|uniref:Flagellar FliJ protein n=1 Tax=Cellvibrio japonicus (strain Ueda107) TaxID=498211 RepID=B3PEZ1_CELJU|nr:flagellar export protein FliJ [Cellvibrio japonicus]ACE83678.1 putative flagellar protein FliJ [Cellvibrio japonicus Ueda107]QEI12237.1 flagellar export protein FliJ [Cellvibrio japonicus]QEI15811.1 flagellar export protein FliJ [Cellvibrio japonicus]QEI19389.1 flagellar export protein FliJ [Cellvibrio japonicus]
MAESRAQRIRVVLTLAQRQEDTAAERLGQYRDQVRGEEEQLAQLRDYAAQYTQDYASQRQGIYAHQLMNYSGFVARLGELCREQEAKLKRMQLTLNKMQEQWRQCHQKRKSIEDLIERFKREDAVLLDKRLQKELDELTTQKFSRIPSRDE